METQENFAPYAPTENVLRVLNKARGGNVRGPIDTNYLIQLGINDSMAPRAIRALAFLGFIDNDGNTAPRLDEYIKANDEEARRVLRQALEDAYHLIFRAVDPEVATRQQVFNAFRMMTPRGQWDRMVTLFLGLCREAGFDVKEAPPVRIGKDSSGEPRRTKVRGGVKPAKPDRPATRWSIEGAGDRDFFDFMTTRPQQRDSLDPSLLAFLGKLRDIETLEALDTWYQAFKGLFAYVLATKPKPTAPESAEDQDNDS